MGKMKFGEKAKNPKATFLRLMKDVLKVEFIMLKVLVATEEAGIRSIRIML